MEGPRGVHMGSSGLTVSYYPFILFFPVLSCQYKEDSSQLNRKDQRMRIKNITGL